MKSLFITWPLVLLLGTTIAQEPKHKQPENRNVIVDVLQAASSAQMFGFLEEKLDSSYQNRILAQDVDRLISPFQNRTETNCWQTEFWGKWFTSAILAYQYRPEPQLKKLLKLIRKYFSNYQTKNDYTGF